MQKIRLKNTQPELILRRALTKLGIRYRLNYSKLPGKPDIVVPKYKLAIFVDGEFWHGYQWKAKKTRIKANRDYWIPKIERTIKRDKRITKEIRSLGFTVLRFWEQQIRRDLDRCVELICKQISEVESQPAKRLSD